MIAAIFRERGSVLNRINPAMSFLALTILVLLPSLFLDPITPASFWLIGVIGAWPLARLSPLYLLRRLLPYLTLCFGLFMVNALLYGGEQSSVLFTLGTISLSSEAVLFAASVSLRVLCLVTYSQIFASATDPTLLTNSLIMQAHIPYRFAFGVLAAYRFIPVLAAELQQIRAAHRVRGAYRRGLHGVLFRVRRIGIPLLAGGIRKAERLALAMDARNFAVASRRTFFRKPGVRIADWVFLAGIVVIAASIIVSLRLAGLSHGFLAGAAETATGVKR